MQNDDDTNKTRFRKMGILHLTLVGTIVLAIASLSILRTVGVVTNPPIATLITVILLAVVVCGNGVIEGLGDLGVSAARRLRRRSSYRTTYICAYGVVLGAMMLALILNQ